MITTLSATAADVPGWLLLPFVLMLLTIALAPVLFERFWEENRNKLIVALAIGIPTAGILFYRGLGENLVHTARGSIRGHRRHTNNGRPKGESSGQHGIPRHRRNTRLDHGDYRRSHAAHTPPHGDQRGA